MDHADQWRRHDASNPRDAARDGAVDRSYVGDRPRRRRARTRWGGTSHHHDGRPAPQKRPSGSVGDLPQPVQFVAAAGSGAAVPSRSDPENSRKPAAAGPCDQASQAAAAPPEAGSLVANAVVANMMKRMNYKGSGLGKHGQGITAPIELALRLKNAGLGSVEGPIDWGAEDTPPSAENWPKWEDSGGGGKKKWSRDFAGPEREDAVTAAQKRDQQEELDVEMEILATSMEKGSAAEAVARVQIALAEAAPGGGDGQGDLCFGEETVTAITDAMKWVGEESASGKLTLAELIRKFKALKETYPREYAAFRLADAARAIVTPPMRSLFRRQWDPLRDPSRGLSAVAALRDVLLPFDDDDDSSPFPALVGDVVVRAVLAAEWNARDHVPMLRFLETWRATLPPDAVHRLLQEAVVPRLAAAVEALEPAPCHAWAHPWVPLLLDGGGLERELERVVYATMRRKLGQALASSWHAPRAGADYHMVVPWRDAFGPAEWAEFVDRSVVPYLREGLRELRVIAPPKRGDGGDVFRAVMRWAFVVEAREMARLLDEEFFGKWMDALWRWLMDERPEVEEAVAWHEGWERQLTPKLLADERVRVPIEAGLDMISRSAQGLEINRPAGLRGSNHATGEAHSCRYKSRRRVGVGREKNKRY